jgi:branched-chain amino acid transport system ATP-binding protein
MTLLSLEGLVAGYGSDAPILHGVNISLQAGEIVSIIGPNGAGKSTAMKSAFGLLNVHQGKILIDAEDVTNSRPEAIVRKGVSFVPQTENVFASLTVQENLELGGYFNSRSHVAAGLDRIYSLFPPLREKRHQKSGLLSGGQRQMVAMGRALMPGPKIILLDEPTAGLSPKYADEIFKLIIDINASGTTVLMVEQNARQALMISNRGYVLVDGRNRHEGKGADLVRDREVAEMFLGG